MSKEPAARRTLSLKEKAKERLAGFTNLNRSYSFRGKSKSIEVPSEQTGDAASSSSNTSRPRSWLSELEGHVFENPLSWDNLDISEGLQNKLNSGELNQNTANAQNMAEESSSSNAEAKMGTDKKRSRHHSKPHGTKDYEVTQRDTLNSIAAKFDTTPSELVKLNKLILRTIIPGQVLYVPVKEHETSEPNSPAHSPVEDKPAFTLTEDGITDLQGTRPRSPSSPANTSPTTGRRYLFAGKVMSAGGYFEDPTHETFKSSSSYTDLAKAAISMSFQKLKTNKKPELPLIQQLDRSVSKGPGLATRQSPDPVKMEADGSVLPHALSEDEARTLDEECLERFIKVNVKYITDGQGVVSGVLLVTPNAIMFDPNVSDPLVLEHGADAYGMIAPMETIISAAIYHDIAAMKLSSSKKEPTSPTSDEPKHHEVYHSAEPAGDKVKTKDSTDSSMMPQQTSQTDTPSEGAEPSKTGPIESIQKAVVELTVSDSVGQVDSQTATSSSDQPSSQKLTQNELSVVATEVKDSEVSHKKTESDSVVISPAVEISTATTTEQTDSPVVVSIGDALDLPHLELIVGGKDGGGSDGGSVESGIAEMHDERSSVEEGGATKSPPSSSSLTPHMQIGNITYFQYDDVNQEKASSEEKTAYNSDKAKDSADGGDAQNTEAAQQKNIIRRTIGSLTSLTGTPNFSSLVDFSSGLFTRSQDERGRVKDVSEADLAAAPPKIEANLPQPQPQRKSNSHDKKQVDISVESVIKLDDKPELFQSLDELIPKPAALYEDPPLYLCLRVGKPINKKVSKTCPIESYSKRRKKPEYWFSIPKERVDHLYAFFVQWSPEIYGGDDEIDPKERGFVVIDDKEEEELDIIDEHFTGSRLIKQVSKDWEIVKVEEARRRLSLAEEESLPLPEMNNESTILKEEHIRKLNKHLPPRTVGYPWSLIYSTDKHGFSLKSLYRLMPKDDSPILLVVKDTENNVFGAMVSCSLHVSDHFYGTGESFLFTFYPEFKKFDWSGENNFFVKGNLTSLSIGAGQGVYGLWVDGDIYHGHTQKCATYNNEILTSNEDFVVKGLEAWGFD